MKKLIAIFVLLLASALVFSLAAFSIDAAAAGELTVTGGTIGTDYDYSGGVLTIKSSTPITISGTTNTDKIVVDSTSGAKITLSGVNIDVSSLTPGAAAFDIAAGTTGTVTITLAGKNTLKSGTNCAGLQKTSNDCLLVIQGEGGELEATGAGFGAGIGGGFNHDGKNITIKSGNIKAGGASGAGIGGGGGDGTGGGGDGTNITIEGGTVTATSGGPGAGIGGGRNGNGINITISGGEVTATSTESGAGIGGGNGTYYENGGNASNITISGGKVTAKSNGGAGIGSGINFNPTTMQPPYNPNGQATGITISGGEVTATGYVGIGGTWEKFLTDGNFSYVLNMYPDNSTVKIQGTSSTHCPIVQTNSIRRKNTDEYWGILFLGMSNDDFMNGTVYGTGKAVDLSKRTETYTLGAGKKLTVLNNVTFVTDNKFKLDGSVLYLNAGAKLKYWYEMEKVNGGEIQHEDASTYKWYDSETYGLADYDMPCQHNGKEGFFRCEICGTPEPHDPTKGNWIQSTTHHWHLEACDCGTDCSVNSNQVTTCSYFMNISGENRRDYGVHRYKDTPDKVVGDTEYYYCIDCNWEKKVTGSDDPTPTPTPTPTPSTRTGIIKIYKVDYADGSPLEGAKFGLYSDEECTSLIKSAVSEMDDDRAVVYFKVSAGDTYYVKEISAPSGYRLSGKVFRAKVSSNGTVTYSVVGTAGTSEDIPVCANVKATGNPGTAAGIGVAGIAAMSGIVCVTSIYIYIYSAKPKKEE